MKAALQFIAPFIKKYPGPALLIILMVMSLWGYYSLASGKADKAIVDSLHAELSLIQGELKGMARYFTGKESFNGEDIKTLPPQEYLVGIDTDILSNDFDSCKQGMVIDTVTGRHSWYCWSENEVFIFK